MLHQLYPSRSATGPHIEKTVCFRVERQMHGRVRGVLNLQEVAVLFAIALSRMCTLEKPDLPGSAYLFKRFMCDAAHFAFMTLVRSENIEIHLFTNHPLLHR